MHLPGYFTFSAPEALVLALPLVWLYLRRLRNRNLWRGVMLALAVLALGLPKLVQVSRGVDVFVLADRSRSVGEEGLKKESELTDLIGRRMGAGDRLGVVSFNERAHIERAPAAGGEFKGFETPYSPDASDLGDGLRAVLGQARPGRQTRVIVMSDGEHTGPDPLREARLARRDGVKIFYRDLKRLDLFNLSVREARMPEKILTGEPFRVAYRVSATRAAEGRYRLYRNGKVVGAETNAGWRDYAFKPGDNEIAFHDLAGAAGINQYRLEVESKDGQTEPFTGDNSAERYVQAVGERPLLLVNNTGAPDNVSAVLSAGGVRHSITAIGAAPLTIAALSGYKSVILNNVAVLGLSSTQLRALRDFVEQEGGGLMVCGGNRSYANGGYYKSTLDDILPVSLEDRQESKKVSTAFSIVLDRSGSMQATTPSGQTKMKLAANAAAESIALMSGADSLSVIPVDSAAHILVPQQPVEDGPALMAQARSIESMGGGIFVYTGLVAAGSEILKAPQLNKHILLFADAADAEEPGDYKKLLEDFKKAGVTVSVIGLGTDKDSDAEFLKDVAKLGGGTVYFTDDASRLAQFFTADTLTYTRQSFIEDPVGVNVQTGAFALAPDQKWVNFTASHYNLLYARPKAEIALLSADEDAAPLLAFWQSGLGRVVALALDPERSFAQTKNYGDIVLDAARWAAGSEVDDNLQIRTDYQGNYARVAMEVGEAEAAKTGLATMEIYTPGGKTVTRPLQWSGRDRLEGDFKLTETGLYRGVIKSGGKTWKIGPVSLPVSPEFQYEGAPGAGRRMLAALAAETGGREALDMRALFEGDGVSRESSPFVLPLLIALAIMMLLEIAEPRFGLLGLMRAAWRRGRAGVRERWRETGRAHEPVMADGSQALMRARATVAAKAAKPKPAPPAKPLKPTPAPIAPVAEAPTNVAPPAEAESLQAPAEPGGIDDVMTALKRKK